MSEYIVHSAKGSTWKKHKYIKIVNGVYYYGKDAKNQGKPKRTVKEKLGLLTGATQKKDYEKAALNAKRQQGYLKNEEEKYRKAKGVSERVHKDKSSSNTHLLATHGANKALYKQKNKTLAQAKKSQAANAAANDALKRYRKSPLGRLQSFKESTGNFITTQIGNKKAKKRRA